MNCVVVFTADRFDRSWPDGGADPNSPPLGNDVATFFCGELASLGVVIVGNAVVEGEHGWHWEASFDGQVYDLFAHWAPIGNPPKDSWVIQIGRKRGVLASFLGRRAGPGDVTPMAKLLAKLIDRDPTFENVRWLTAAEFGAVY